MHSATIDIPVEDGQSWEVDLFRPEDAPGVVRLFRAVYGEGYPIETYTNRQRLIEENAARRTISTVARTPNGDIVGHVAVFQNAPYSGLYEAGSGLVLPNYRGGSIMTKLVAQSFETAAGFGVEALFGEAVCNHTHMQRLMSTFDNVPRALAVDLMPADTYAREKSASGRVSVVVGFTIFKPKPQAIFYPRVYGSVVPFLYQGMEEQRSFSVSDEALPSQASTRIETQIFNFARVARMSVQNPGPDLVEVLEREENRVRDKGVAVIQVWLQLSWPWVGAVTDLLRAHGYFLGGVLPRWFDADGLLLQKILETPNWEEIQLHASRAKTILEMIRLDWARVCGGV